MTANNCNYKLKMSELLLLS